MNEVRRCEHVSRANETYRRARVREVPSTTPRPARLPYRDGCEACGDAWLLLVRVRFGLPLPDAVTESYRVCRRCSTRAHDNLAAFMRAVGKRTASARLPEHAH